MKRKKEKEKLPWMPFYPLDWLGDTRQLTNRQKGIWIDLLAYMWMAKPRGKITGTWDSIARMVGEPWHECETEIVQMSRKKVLELSEADGLLTLISRRIIRDEKKRESQRLRQSEYEKRKILRDPDAILTGIYQKSEVRSHISEKDLKTKEEESASLRDAPPSTPKTPIQKIVQAYKILTGFEHDPTWDKVYYPRCAKAAKGLLDFFAGDWKAAVDCMEEKVTYFREKNLTFTLETVIRHAPDYKRALAEQAAKEGR